jgi:hypothetical protein
MLPQERRRTFASSLLLCLVIFTVFVIPLFSVRLHKTLYTVSYSAVFWAALFSFERHRRPIFVFALVTMIMKVITDWILIENLNRLAQLMTLVFFFVVIIQLLSQIVRQHCVTPRVILEAINGYLLLGLCFSVLVTLLAKMDDQAFSFSALEGSTFNFRCVYFAFVTLSTLGYGDLLALTPPAQSLAILTSVVGQLYLTVVIALLIGKYIGFWSAREMAGRKNGHR